MESSYAVGRSVSLETSVHEEIVFLLSIASEQEYIDFIRTRAYLGEMQDVRVSKAEWRAARASMADVRACDKVASECWTTEPVPHRMQAPLAAALYESSDPEDLADAEVEWKMVSPGELIVWQRAFSLATVEKIIAGLPSVLTEEALVALVSGRGSYQPTVRSRRLSESVFCVISDSRDFRFLGLRSLKKAQTAPGTLPANAAHIIAASVGFSSNMLCAYECGGRLILANGTHRAGALFKLGVRKVPCLIRRFRSESELREAAPMDLNYGLADCLASERPPLLKDYWNESLRRTLAVPYTRKMIQIQISVQETVIPFV